MVAVSMLIVPSLNAQVELQDIGKSHIEANVPAQVEFSSLLTRDLIAFFRKSDPKITEVNYDLLRSEPTQTGISYPKYYAWVQVLRGKEIVEEGAVRLSAVEKKRFEVLEFLSRSEINADPAAVPKLFPEPLVEGIVRRAVGSIQ